MSKLYNLEEVIKNVKTYFKENLTSYTVLNVRRKSYHPNDAYLYMVSAKKSDGTYAIWTCWNEETQCLNYGHYDLSSEEDCEKLMDEFYYAKK